MFILQLWHSTSRDTESLPPENSGKNHQGRQRQAKAKAGKHIYKCPAVFVSLHIYSTTLSPQPWLPAWVNKPALWLVSCKGHSKQAWWRWRCTSLLKGILRDKDRIGTRKKFQRFSYNLWSWDLGRWECRVEFKVGIRGSHTADTVVVCGCLISRVSNVCSVDTEIALPSSYILEKSFSFGFGVVFLCFTVFCFSHFYLYLFIKFFCLRCLFLALQTMKRFCIGFREHDGHQF